MDTPPLAVEPATSCPEPRAAATARGGPRPWLATSLVALLCAIWGSTWLVIQEGLEDLPPMTSLAWRLTIAGALFAALTPRLRRLEGGGDPSLVLSLVQGVLIFALPYGLIYWAETRLPSGLSSVLWAVFPLLLAATSSVFLPHVRLGRLQWIGLGLGFLGVAALFATDLRSLGAGAGAIGALFLVSPLSSAVGNAWIKRDGAAVSSLALNRNGLALGAGLVWLLVLALERDALVHWSGRAIFSVLYLAILGTVVAFGLYYWLLRYFAAHALGLIAYVVPAIAVTLGWAFRGEPVGWTTLAGAALILAGVTVVAR